MTKFLSKFIFCVKSMLKYVFCKKNNATKKPGAFTFIKRLGAFARIEMSGSF